MTVARLHARHGWAMPVIIGTFLLFALLAFFHAAPWDEPVTNAVVDLRTPWLDTFFKKVSFLGSTPVVLFVGGLAALLSVRRCPRLAIAIVVIVLARPLCEHVLKELVSRERPDGNRMVTGTGNSFPSGHPLATASTWGTLPLVLALYTRRRVLWWSVVIVVSALSVFVAASRVYLGVHWLTDVVGSLLLAVIGIAAAERFIEAAHGGSPKCSVVNGVVVCDTDTSIPRDLALPERVPPD